MWTSEMVDYLKDNLRSYKDISSIASHFNLEWKQVYVKAYALNFFLKLKSRLAKLN